MKQLEKILVPIDINSNSKEQINAAIEIAQKYNSAINIIYVLPNDPVSDKVKEILQDAIATALNKIKETFRKAGVITKEPLIEHGRPVDKILKTAVKENVNLIIAGSGNKKEKEQYKLGNTAEKLIRHSDTPVLVVKPDKKTKVTNILCPVDFSEPSKYALKNAILLSQRFEAKLRILSVVEPITNVSPKIIVDLERENAYRLKQYRKEMKQFIQEFDLKGINHEIDIQTGIVHKEILHSIKENGHDLLIMGTTGRSGLRRVLMGSIAEKVTREMPCSFITIKMQDIIRLRFDQEVSDIKNHFIKANDLVEKGKYEEAISQYLICLQINNMHIPSIYKLAVVNSLIGRKAKADYYENMAQKLLDSLWDSKIKDEIGTHFNFE